MARFKIYDKSGKVVRCELDKFEYSGEYMGKCHVSFSVSSAEPINFEIGDYMEYRGERFYLNYVPTETKQATRNSMGEAFKYSDVKMNSVADELTRCDFLDVVTSDNNIHFTSLPTFSFYATSVRDLASRIQANLDRVNKNAQKWSVKVSDDYQEEKKVNVSANNLKVWDALALVNSEFKTNFVIRGRNITIGTQGIAVGNIFKYGKGNGLYQIQRNSEQDQQVVTRLRAYGSDKNLPLRYYNKMVDGSGKTYVQNHMAVTRLMLPDFPKKSTDPYIDSANIGKLGVREGTVIFDGSDDNEEIFPTLKGMTASQLKEAGVDVVLDSDDNGNLDEVKSAEVINDDGIFEEETEIPGFTITLKDIGFDINDYLGAENATISMLDGMCGGREFEIASCAKDGNTYKLVCKRVKDYSLNMYFPNNVYKIKAGDKYTLLNINMPDVYIQAASQRLLTAAKAYLAKNDYVRYTYNPSVDDIYMARQHDEAIDNGQTSLHDTIKEGDLMIFSDNDLLIDGTITIDRLVIKENENRTPQYEITLKEEKTVGTIQKIQNKIDSIVSGGANGGGGYTSQQLQSLIRAFGSAFFLRKDQNDRTAHEIASDLAFELGKFVSGASGAKWFVDQDGNTRMELDKLYVRMKAYFETLEIVNVNSVGGKQIISPAGSIRVNKVEDTGTAYRCYFLTEQDGEKVENRFTKGDQGYSQTFNAKVGVSNQISNRYYWRLVTAVGDDYIDLSKTDCDTGSDAPAVGDVICQLGNRNDSDRQNAIEISSVDSFSPSITLYEGINSYTKNGKNAVQFGVDKTSGKAFMNVYGEMYMGDREETSYIKYTQDGGLEIKGKLSVGTQMGNGKTLEQALKDATDAAVATSSEDISAFQEQVLGALTDLQEQLDGVVDTWFGDGAPSLDGYPSSEWTTDALKEDHLGDLYYDSQDGNGYRFQNSDGVYKWVVISDSGVTKALEAAAKAQDTADGKRRVFVKQPTKADAYDVGDMWVNATYEDKYSNDVLRATTAKVSGAVFSINHWTKASKYTDDTKAEAVQANVDTLKTTVNGISDNVSGMQNFTDKAFADGVIERSERTAIQNYVKTIETTTKDVEGSYNDVYSNSLLNGTTKTALKNAYDAFKASATELTTEVTNTIADDVVTTEERASVDNKYTNFNTKYGEFVKAITAANKAIQDKINANATSALTAIGELKYIKDALSENTSIEGGLIQSTVLALGYTNSNKERVTMAGTSGIYDASKNGGGIASWWGGGMYDRADYTDSTMPSNVAKGVIRMDGSGYLANGAIWWGTDGKLHADPQSFIINENQIGDYVSLFQIIYKSGYTNGSANIDYIIPKYTFQNATVADYVRIGDAMLQWDSTNKAIKVVKADGTKWEGTIGFYSEGWVSALGASADVSGGGGSVELLSDWTKYSSTTGKSVALSAYLGKQLKDAVDGAASTYLGKNATAADSDKLDGYQYTSFEADHKVEIDTRALNKDTWYPVTMDIGNSRQTRIRVEGLSDTTSGWNTRSDKKMAVILDYVVNGSQWGWTGVQRVVYRFSQGAGAIGNNVLRGLGQLTNSSTEYVYVRGGAVYNFYVSRFITPVLRTSTYTVSEQSVSPTTTMPAEIVQNNALTSSNVASATKLASSVSINGTAFDGSADITTESWGASRNIFIKDASGSNIGAATSVNGSTTYELKLPSTIKATLDGNAGTASKLYSAVNLWGQSFDGSKAISGNMTGVGSVSANGDNVITKTTTANTQFKVANTSGSVALLTAVNRGVYDVTSDKWLIGTNGTNTFLSEGNVGIGTTTPEAPLEVDSSEWKTLVLRRTTSTSAGAGIYFYASTEGLGYLGINGSKQLEVSKMDGTRLATMLMENGNLGLGTNNPTEKLHINGNAKATTFIGDLDGSADKLDGLHATAFVRKGLAGSSNGVYVKIGNVSMAQNGNKSVLRLFNASGYNASNAQTRITDIYLQTSNNSSAVDGLYISAYAESHRWGGYNYYIVQNSKTSFDIWSDKTSWTGNVSYEYSGNGTFTADGSTTASALPSGAKLIAYYHGLYENADGMVEGNVYATGAITALTDSSDIRLKKDFANYNALELLSKIDAVSYKWNDKAKKYADVMNTDETQYGFIAQQLKEAGFGQYVRKVGEYYVVDYERFIPIAVKAIQELASEVKQLKARV